MRERERERERDRRGRKRVMGKAYEEWVYFFFFVITYFEYYLIMTLKITSFAILPQLDILLKMPPPLLSSENSKAKAICGFL